MRAHVPQPEDTPLRQAIKAIVVGSRSERDLVNRIEELVKAEVASALAEPSELNFPERDLGGES